MAVQLNQFKRDFIEAVIAEIRYKAPDVANKEVSPNYFEGERRFDVEYNQYMLECIRRSAFIDTSDYDYCSGTGDSYDVVYDYIAVLSAYDTASEQGAEELCNDLNERLSWVS